MAVAVKVAWDCKEEHENFRHRSHIQYENFIARTISCLQEQEEPNLEFLLVNDGSTDSTLSLMQKMCEGDARFQIFTMKNRGYGLPAISGSDKPLEIILPFLSRMIYPS